MANAKKMARREAMGDNMGMTVAPQPNPGLPQGPGNVMNRPATDMNGQMGMPMNTGGPGYNYGDMVMDAKTAQKLGSVGFVGRSDVPSHVVPGRGMNQTAYNTQQQPDKEQMAMMEPMYDFAAAQGIGMPNGINNNLPVSYNITALGPTGFPMYSGMVTPGAIPPQMQTQDLNTLPLQGGGMDTGRGGGRNKGKK